MVLRRRLGYLASDQQLGDNGGNLVFIASSRHTGEMRAQPRFVVKVPVLLREMRFESGPIGVASDLAAG